MRETIKLGDTYGLHYFMYDITLRHFKSKTLCKLGSHLYMLKYDTKMQKEEIEQGDYTVTYYRKIFSPVYYKCHCCGKEVDIQEREI